MSDPPLNLAGVPHVDDSLIDPTLAAQADAFFSAAGGDHKFDDELAAAAAVAAAAAHQHAHGGQHQHLEQHVGGSGLGGFPHTLSGVGVDVMSVPMPSVNHNASAGPSGEGGLEASDKHRNMSPMVTSAHMAPFSRPHRDENTPHPENLTFANRAEFEVWFEGESSWCHFVQRRTTTPEKRAEERLRARIKAHERLLANMTPEEAANAPPLKRRRRNRTSNIKEKVTYTCHHAGRYEAKHSTTLPRERLRLNTKKSVKCDCPARIVLTEMEPNSELEEGECKVSYFWRHEGHDAYAEDELESGRLPKVIDEWLIAQIQAGKDTDQIRRSLMMTDEEKQAYLRQIAEDPSSVDPDKPPPLALTLRIKYPDIYNRYRKLKGPIKDFKPPKHPRVRKRQREDDVKPSVDGDGVGALDLGVVGEVDVTGDVTVDAAAGVQHEHDAVAIATAAAAAQQHVHQEHDENQPFTQVDGFAALRDAIEGNMGDDPFGGHEGLERALLALPRNSDGDGATADEFSEAVLRMASQQDKESWSGVSLEQGM